LTYQLIGGVERFVVRKGASQVVAVSQSLAREATERYNLPPGRVSVIPNGVDTETFHPDRKIDGMKVRADFSIPSDQALVLFIGYNFVRKGLDTLVSALERLNQEDGHPDVHLVVVGGRGREAYEAQVSMRLGGRVFFAGAHRDVAAFYGASDVCVLPSFEEPFGLPILEAMACGVPVIVSRCSGVAEVIDDGRDGLLLEDPADHVELAEKLRALLTCPKRRQEIGKNARTTAQQYSWTAIGRQTESLYKKIVQQLDEPEATETLHG
jgi:UDP-glucose:(heptosyl)LPS alpha-1,3-glucosyltransferase